MSPNPSPLKTREERLKEAKLRYTKCVVVTQDIIDFPLYVSEMPEGLRAELVAQGKLKEEKGVASWWLLDDDAYWEAKSIKKVLPDYCAAQGWYSERAKNAMDAQGFQYQAVRAVCVYNQARGETYKFWEIEPLIIDCLDRENTLRLRNEIEGLELPLEGDLDLGAGRFIIDPQRCGETPFFCLPEQPRMHLIADIEKAKILSADKLNGRSTFLTQSRPEHPVWMYGDRLHIAIRQGDFPTVKRIVDAFGIVDEFQGNINGMAPLKLALSECEYPSKFSIFTYLVQHGTSVTFLKNQGSNVLVDLLDTVGNTGMSPMQHDAYQAVLARLDELGIKFNATAVFKQALCFVEDASLFKDLLDRGANAKKADSDSEQVLLAMAKLGDLALVQRCFEQGAGFHDFDYSLRAALGRAHLDVAHYLIAQGSNIHFRHNYDSGGHTSVLREAVKEGYVELARRILSEGAPMEPELMLDAADSKQPEMLRLMLEYGGDLQVRTSDGGNLLRKAVDRHYWIKNHVGDTPGCVKLLLDAGLDIHDTAKNGTTPLLYAIQRSTPDVVQLLLDRGARLDNPAEALDRACMTGLEMTRLVLAQLPDFDIRSVGRALLFGAVNFAEDLALLQFLLEAGVEEGCGKSTLLEWCLRHGQLAMADYLLTSGRISDREDWNAHLRMAIQQSPLYTGDPAQSKECSQRIIQALIRKGADPKLPDRENITALHLAKHACDPGLMTLLLKTPLPPAQTQASNIPQAIQTMIKATLAELEEDLKDDDIPKELKRTFKAFTKDLKTKSLAPVKTALEVDLRKLMDALMAPQGPCACEHPCELDGQWEHTEPEINVTASCSEDCHPEGIELACFEHGPEYDEARNIFWSVEEGDYEDEEGNGYEGNIPYNLVELATYRFLLAAHEVMAQLEASGIFLAWAKPKPFTLSFHVEDGTPFQVYQYDPAAPKPVPRPAVATPPAGPFRRFECSEDGSNKFWEVSVSGCDLTVRFGKLGTSGQSKTKSFPSGEKAEAEQAKLIREKTGKGYQEV